MSIWTSLRGIVQRFGPRKSDLAQWYKLLPGLESVSGERVTYRTALGLAAFFACVRNISEDEAKLPLPVFRKTGRSRTEVDHAVGYLLNVEPNPEMSAMDFRQALTAYAAGMGNGYAEIVVDGRMVPEAFWLLDPDTVKPKREEGKLYYEVRVGAQEPVILMAGQVLHLHGMSPDGIGGYNIPNLAREALGAALACQKFAAAFYGNGAWPGGALEHPAALSDKALAHLRDSFVERHGGAAKAHKLLILEEDMKYNQLGIAPEQAQFIETQYFNVEQVCRYFRMPPHKAQHLLRATFSNISEQDLEYVGDTMMPWHIRWEQEIKRKCFSKSTERNLYVRHNVTALLRADAKTRALWYAAMRQNGIYSPNDVLALEDMNPIPAEEGGDDHHVQVNMVRLRDVPVPGDEPKPEPPALPEPEDDDEDERFAGLVGGHREALLDAYARVLRVEADKAQRAQKRNELDEWAAEFYPIHEKHVAEVLAPILSGLGATVAALGTPRPDAPTLAAELAARYIARQKEDITEQATEAWTDGRAASAADDAIAFLCDQLQGEVTHATA